MEPSRKSRSLQDIEREIESELKLLNDMKVQSDWINEYNRSEKLSNGSTKHPKYNKNISYYEQFWKTYLINEMIILKAKELTLKNKQLAAVIGNIEVARRIMQELLKERSKMLSERHQKKKRRTSSEINKAYKCPYHDCNKRYGCDVSMNLHIKLKHLGGNKTEREQLAVIFQLMQREICESEINGTPTPPINLIFPPGYLESFKEQYKDRLKKSGHLGRKQ